MNLARRYSPAFLAALCLGAAVPCVSATGTPGDQAKASAADASSDHVGFFESLLPTAWQKRPQVRFNVYTEMTPEGRKRPEPSPDHPLRYSAPPGTFAQIGWQPSAGEKPPPWQQLQASMEKALADNGYLAVDDTHARPDVLIVFTFGSSGTDLAALAIKPPDDPEEPNQPVFPPPVTAEELLTWMFKDPRATSDVIERARFIGGDKVANELVQAMKEEASNARMNATVGRAGGSLGLPVSPDDGSPFQLLLHSGKGDSLRNVLELAFHTCYFVTATAYDFNGVTKKQKIPLWQTRMSVEAQGTELTEVLRPLIVNTGAFIGRETPEAVIVTKRLDRAGHVEVGTETVIKDDVPAPSADATSKK